MTEQFNSQGIEVKFGNLFQKHYANFSKSDILIIAEFIQHIQKFGFDGLQGRNKSSDDVPTNNPNWLADVRHAQKYKLWHYHIGIPHYVQSAKGDFISEYILHYIREQDFIVIVDMSAHPPFELPKDDYLIY